MSEKKRPASEVLSPRDMAIAEAVLDGKTLTQAAKEAGCSPATARSVVRSAGSVKMYLEDHRDELRNAAQIQRGDVVAGFMEAIDIARLAADPGSMIRGWSEIGKMLGLYAPEKKEITLTAGQRQLKSKFEVMSDEELLEIMEKGGRVIDGDCVTVV